VKIIIGGDLVPTKNNIDEFEKGNIDNLVDSNLQNKWFSADYRIFNLETPLADKESPIYKSGPHLLTSTNSINGINKLQPSLISMANNHIMDHGIAGYKSTINILDNNNLDYLGVGENLNRAGQPYTFEKENKKIGIYACAEHEFTIATSDKLGANPFDPLESLDHITELSKKSDHVIVLYHGLKEHYRYPTPEVQKVCRKMIEKGADLILCQHSHCIGSFEEYSGGTILYGQGNFIFNMRDNEYWNTGLLVEIEIDNENFEVNFIPFKSNSVGIQILEGQEKDNVLTSFYNRSKKIKDREFVKSNYSEFAYKQANNYLRNLSFFGKWLSRIDRIIFNNFFLNRLFTEKNMLFLLNTFQCEAHRELIIQGIKEKLIRGNNT
jgi:poly-gamma-glutamate synthesis protein (capsule biosynthesis protein)